MRAAGEGTFLLGLPPVCSAFSKVPTCLPVTVALGDQCNQTCEKQQKTPLNLDPSLGAARPRGVRLLCPESRAASAGDSRIGQGLSAGNMGEEPRPQCLPGQVLRAGHKTRAGMCRCPCGESTLAPRGGWRVSQNLTGLSSARPGTQFTSVLLQSPASLIHSRGRDFHLMGPTGQV